MKVISGLLLPIFTLFLQVQNTYAQPYKVIETNTNHLVIEFNFSNQYNVSDTVVDGLTYQKINGEDHSFRSSGNPWIPDYVVIAGVPFDSKPTITILDQKKLVIKNQFIIPVPEEDPVFFKHDLTKINKEVYSKNEFFPKSGASLDSCYSSRYAYLLPIRISPYQFNPVTRDLVYNSYFKIRIDFNAQNLANYVSSISDGITDEFLKSSVVNYNEAKNFTGKITKTDLPIRGNSNWYNTNKNYFKIFVNKKDVYRITYEEFIAAGVQLGVNTPVNKLELFNDGLATPIEVFDNNNDTYFNNGDYLQFIGFQASPSLYCQQNIYNKTNVYWFSYESDSTGLNYSKNTNDIPNYNRTYFRNLTTLHFEKDSLFERLGYAPNDQRDFWFWDKTFSRDSIASYAFNQYFDIFPLWYSDSAWVRVKVAMQGISNSNPCPVDHKAYVLINDREIGSILWDGQRDVVFDKFFYASPDSIPIFEGNYIKVEARGDVCWDIDDEIRINWFDFEYWRANTVYGNYYNFINHDVTDINRYGIFDWQGSDMRVYAPDKNKMIYIAGTASYVQFVDTMSAPTEYFLTSSDYYKTVDSIVADSNSDLRNFENGADYLIITHKKFLNIANQLANFRANNFPDESIPNPRIKVVVIQDIYDEFSFGLLDPWALREFYKYTFENWQIPAPGYVVLIGDMSYDYRGILTTSRPSFIPAIPYFAGPYGQTASDNIIVAVTGTDFSPDAAIGRLSIETVEEGNILLQKLIDYPDDPAKHWKQDVLLLASGLNLQDEIQFGFNDASLYLGNTYVIPNGYQPSYVFRYPSKPEHEPYQGEGPRIREEINEGTVLINYYGHGGGYQWDLVFTSDDIYLLENGGRLPVISSVTCYTAHFDNQNVFGEQFNKVSGKGSIGFWGSSALTYWGVGKAINEKLFDEIFNLRNFIFGKAIMNAKNRVPSGGIYGTQINLLQYLGDPVMKLALPNYPDFEIKSSDITINPENPLVGDSIEVKINILNWGAIFPNDSVVVELFAGSVDTSYQIGSVKRGNFGEKDSVYFPWTPKIGGLYTLRARVNETEIILEEDHSDNIGVARFVIFNINEPSAITPIDGFVSTKSNIDFLFSDVGYYVDKDLKYYVEIDTSFSDDTTNFFNPPLFQSGELIPTKSFVSWNSPILSQGVYFWRARIFDGTQYGNWSPVKSFSIMNETKEGYFAHDKILKTFETQNIIFADSSKSLSLNTEPRSARPHTKTYLGSFLPNPQLPDSLKLSTITTDGTYIYFANMWFYAQGFTDGMSMIYKVGTGNNGTVEGQFYGTFSNFRDTILNSIFYHSDGNLYVAIGKKDKLVRINVSSEQIDTIQLAAPLLRWDNTRPIDGQQYLTSDGNYVYNLALVDSIGNNKYTLRIFDPLNGWALVGPDVQLFGTSYNPGFTGFFIHGDHIYTCEEYNNFMRQHRISDGFFEEEWLISEPHPQNFQNYFAWCWDWNSGEDKIYASVFRNQSLQIVPKFGKFAGYHVDADGSITTQTVGPVAWWNNVKYKLNNPSPTGVYTTYLLGQNSTTRTWDTLQVDLPDSLSLSSINADLYSNLRLKFNLTDSSFTTTRPMELSQVQFDYQPLSDVYFEREDFNFQQDSLLQGFPITFDFKPRSYGDLPADSLSLNFYLNDLDSLIINQMVSVPADSSTKVESVLETNRLLFENKVLVFGEQNKRESFYFNNLIDQTFYVARDSTRPNFNVKFDGQEIIDGDIVSTTPEVIITLEDNSPLPLDTSYFTIVHNNVPQRFYSPELDWSYTEYPNSKFTATWTPELEDGRHTLEVLAKDASGNFFDSTSYRIIFYVYSENDITEVYNYPNPFASSTHFTFLLRGNEKPDELSIKIYTIAGRLIRDIRLGPDDLITNFNKIFWDGRDQDKDEIGNGVYIYKVIAKFPDKTKTITQKLAKVR